jgi:hypothetical protein
MIYLRTVGAFREASVTLQPELLVRRRYYRLLDHKQGDTVVPNKLNKSEEGLDIRQCPTHVNYKMSININILKI